jgi:hypothetical protein
MMTESQKSSDDDEPSSSTLITLNSASAGQIVEPYDQAIPAHVIRANGLNVHGGCVSLSLLSSEQDYIPDAGPPSYETRFQPLFSSSLEPECEDKSGASSLLLSNTLNTTTDTQDTVIERSTLIDFDQQALDDEMLIHEDEIDDELMTNTDDIELMTNTDDIELRTNTDDIESIDVLHTRLANEPLYTVEEEEESREESGLVGMTSENSIALDDEKAEDRLADAASITRPPSVGTCSSLFASPAVVRRSQVNGDAQVPLLDSPSSSVGVESVTNRNSSLSLAEFERLEQECVSVPNRSAALNRTQRSRHDSLESIGSIGSNRPVTSSHSSLNEFERLENEFGQQPTGNESTIETVDSTAIGEEKALSEIEEGHESQASDSVASISGGSFLLGNSKDDLLGHSDDSDIEFELDSKLDEYTGESLVLRMYSCLVSTNHCLTITINVPNISGNDDHYHNADYSREWNGHGGQYSGQSS